MSKIRVALVGVGNCASALVQGLTAIKRGDCMVGSVLGDDDAGGYSAKDIEIVAAFDVNNNKVGKDLADAIFEKPNCASFLAKPELTSVTVLRGPLLDGIDPNLRHLVPVDEDAPNSNVSKILRDSGVDVLVNYLPSGSVLATNYYIVAALRLGIGVFNAIPVPVANNPETVALAKKHNAPIIGDDVKSQIGATIIHRAVGDLFPMRGGVLDRTIQLDWGGDMDFANLMSNGRYEHGKRKSKTEAVISRHPNAATMDVNVAAVQYIPFLRNTKEAYFRLEGRIFGNMPVNLHMWMSVEDSYDSAGIVIDAIRCVKHAKDIGASGVIKEASAFLCKWPVEQMADAEALAGLTKWLDNGRL